MSTCLSSGLSTCKAPAEADTQASLAKLMARQASATRSLGLERQWTPAGPST